ncbi:MAG: phage tail protein [Nodosilinea sp. WJT8-NPBG4]|jgi:hypothetical protein|nr:phage tail protein [Nodosilinea sp. WJT8-NPBG4]
MSYLGYPAIELTGFWEDTKSLSIRPIEVSTSEGGVVSRSPRDFINKARITWSISGVVKNGLEVDQFLKDSENAPFAFTPGFDADPKLFICNEWNLELLRVDPSPLWKFTSTFKQVFRARNTDANRFGNSGIKPEYNYSVVHFV